MKLQDKQVVETATELQFQAQQGLEHVTKQLSQIADVPVVKGLRPVMRRIELRLLEAQTMLDGLLAPSQPPKQRRVTRKPRQLRYRFA